MSLWPTLLLVLLLGVSPGDRPTQQPPNADLVCGPRCVHRVLLLHGKSDEQLMDLVEEIQPNGLEKGSTFGELERALQRRGIYSRLVPLAPFDVLIWPEPVVVHVDGKHFVVFEGQENGRAKIWDGLNACQLASWWTLWARRPDGALLTSVEPIDPRAAFVRSWRNRLCLFVALATAGAALLMVGPAFWMLKGLSQRRTAVSPTHQLIPRRTC